MKVVDHSEVLKVSVLIWGWFKNCSWTNFEIDGFVTQKIMISYVIVLFSEMLFGVKIVMTGDKPPKSENAIIIMNHRCRLDWMFYWSAVARHGELKHEKIMMKHELKYSPGPG